MKKELASNKLVRLLEKNGWKACVKTRADMVQHRRRLAKDNHIVIVESYKTVFHDMIRGTAMNIQKFQTGDLSEIKLHLKKYA